MNPDMKASSKKKLVTKYDLRVLRKENPERAYPILLDGMPAKTSSTELSYKKEK